MQKTIKQSKPDWSIDNLYRRSWQIVKKNKILWIFGMALGAGASSNSSNSFNSSDFDSLMQFFNKPPESTSELTRVLGASSDKLSETVSAIFGSIPPVFYYILGAEFVFFIIVAIIASIIYSSWAHAGLLEGILLVTNKEKPTIKKISEKAFGDLKSIIYIEYVPYLVLYLISFALLLVFLILFGVLPDSYSLLLIIPSIFGVLTLLITLIVLAFVILWAVRIVVIDKKPARQALSIGYKITKKKFWASVLLGVVNSIATGIVVFIALIPMIGIFALIALNIENIQSLSAGMIGFGILFITAFVILFTILGGIIESFKATVWMLAYSAIRGKYEK